jgi:hypothetical protein
VGGVGECLALLEDGGSMPTVFIPPSLCLSETKTEHL